VLKAVMGRMRLSCRVARRSHVHGARRHGRAWRGPRPAGSTAPHGTVRALQNQRHRDHRVRIPRRRSRGGRGTAAGWQV